MNAALAEVCVSVDDANNRRDYDALTCIAVW